MRSLILTAGLALAAAPALADAQVLGMVASGMMASGTGVENQPLELARGYAVCLLGGGTVAGVETALVDAGLTAVRVDEPDLGLVGFVPEGMPFTIALYDDGAICDVTSESLGTSYATVVMMIFPYMVEFQHENGLACAAGRLLGTVVAEITSSGNDPVCADADTSNVRFTFGAQAAAPAATAAPALTK